MTRPISSYDGWSGGLKHDALETPPITMSVSTYSTITSPRMDIILTATETKEDLRDAATVGIMFTPTKIR